MTLFGIDEKKKRGIVVPMMALAVCAVAMVGLGFALETSVTSNSNAVQSLMIDLDDSGADLAGRTAPNTEKVDGLFSIGYQTNKGNTTPSDSPSIVPTLAGGYAYIMIYGNLATPSLYVKGNSLPTNYEVSFKLYGVDGSDKDKRGTTEVGSVTVKASDNVRASFSGTISCDTVYWVEIVSIKYGAGETDIITFNHGDDGTLSLGNGGAEKLTSLGDGLSLSFTFTASGGNALPAVSP